MRLAVSTLGMPGQGLREAIAIAAAHGCEGLELRLHPDTGVHLEMTEAEQAAARELLTASGLWVIALAGYARVAAPGPDAPVVEELIAGLRLAHDLGAPDRGAQARGVPARGVQAGDVPALRVFPGGTDISAAARRIRAALGDSPGPARVLVETHDELPTGAAVARLLDVTDQPARTGAIWDVLHPWRHGERPRNTLSALRDHLGYVQIKDAAADLTPVQLGTGTVPLDEIGALLLTAGYDGWASLEWERTWYPRAAPVEEILPRARRWTADFSSA